MFSALLLAACTPDNQITYRNDFESPHDWPKAVIDPPELDFGDMSYGEVAEEVISITNDGSPHSTLKISDIMLSAGSEDGYSILPPDCAMNPTCDVELLHGESTEVVVTLTANMAGELQGEMLVMSNDEYAPTIPVPLNGLGVAPMLVIDPPNVMYPDTTVQCTTEQDFAFINVGNDDLIIEEVVQDGVSYVVTDRPFTLPATLAPNESISLTMGFAPIVEGDYPGSLVVTSNDPRGVQEAPVVGTGIDPGTQHVSHTIPAINQLDLLVFVDQSVSMDDDQATLVQNAAAFAGALGTMPESVQVMVVTRDDGCNTGGIMSPSDPDFVAKFQVAVQDGSEGYWSEAGLYVSQLAVEQTNEYLCNAGFLRPGALLHTIFITDEFDSGPVPWFDVVRYMEITKGASHLIKMSAVAGPEPSGCTSSTGRHAGPAKGYAEAVEATHGKLLSICEPWAERLNVVATYGVTRDTFSVDGTPDPTTLNVSVDGMLRPRSDWHYMSDSNSITFDVHPPYSGQTVDITYEVPHVCL